MTAPQVTRSPRGAGVGRRERAALTRVRIVRLVVVPLVLVAIWYLLVAVFGPFAIAPPHAAVGAIVTGFREEWLWPALYITLSTTIQGFVIASVLGLAIATLMGLSRFWGAVLESPLVWLYSIPKVTLYPVFLLVLGLTTESRVAFAVAHGFIPLTLFTYSGMQSVTPVHRRVQRLYRLGWWNSMRRIYVPAAFPSIIVGLRYCFSLCMVGAVVAEMFAAYKGTGYVMIQAMQLHKVPVLFGLTTVLVVFALVVNALFVAWEHQALRRGGTTDG